MGKFKRKLFVFVAILGLLGMASFAMAAEEGAAVASHGGYATTFLAIAIVLLAAKAASLIEKFGQPAVLGELIVGVILGNLILLGIPWFEPLKHNGILQFLAELGVVILLFQIGLESNIGKMKQVGLSALMVAVSGVVFPFVLGTYVVGPLLLPGQSFLTYLFLGAALTATSVGITARVFRDLGKLQIKEAQIVLGAAVFDDIIGLIILAVVAALATLGAVSVGGVAWIAAKAILFLVGAIVMGQMSAPLLGRFFSKINTGVGMKFTLALSFGLVFAYLAQAIGLAPLVGAFAAGLVLDALHFRFFKDPAVVEEVRYAVYDAEPELKGRITHALDNYAHRHIEDLIEPLAYFLVPIFFVMTGMAVSLQTMFHLPVLLVALAISVAAFAGKLVSGIAAGKNVNKILVGVGMVPRGEVGLIFATMGIGLGVISQEVFSVIVIMVIITTLLTPPILSFLLQREDSNKKKLEPQPFSAPLHPAPISLDNKQETYH